MASACASRFRTIDSLAICLACGFESVTSGLLPRCCKQHGCEVDDPRIVAELRPPTLAGTAARAAAGPPPSVRARLAPSHASQGAARHGRTTLDPAAHVRVLGQ